MFEINYKCCYKKNFSPLPKLREKKEAVLQVFITLPNTLSIEGYVLTLSGSFVVSL